MKQHCSSNMWRILIHIILKDTDHSQVTGTYKPKTCSCIESFRSLRASRQDGHQKPRFRCMYPKKKPTSQPIDVYNIGALLCLQHHRRKNNIHSNLLGSRDTLLSSEIPPQPERWIFHWVSQIFSWRLSCRLFWWLSQDSYQTTAASCICKIKSINPNHTKRLKKNQ